MSQQVIDTDYCLTAHLRSYLPQEFGVDRRMPARDLLDHLALLKGFTRAGPRRDIVDHLLRITNLWVISLLSVRCGGRAASP